jgi:hypothetical protein
MIAWNSHHPRDRRYSLISLKENDSLIILLTSESTNVRVSLKLVACSMKSLIIERSTEKTIIDSWWHIRFRRENFVVVLNWRLVYITWNVIIRIGGYIFGSVLTRSSWLRTLIYSFKDWVIKLFHQIFML